MATMVPAIGTCISRMSSGERCLAQRLENKLEADCLFWYDVAPGPRNVHCDFVIFNPHRGLLVLEVKDWHLETIQEIDRQSVTLLVPNGLKRQVSPPAQSWQYAHKIVDLLRRDRQLTLSSGCMKGTLLFPWGYGVALSNITGKQFDSTKLGEVIELSAT